MPLRKEQRSAARSRSARPFFKSLSAVLSTCSLTSHIYKRLTFYRPPSLVNNGAFRELEPSVIAASKYSRKNGSLASLESAAAVIQTDALLPYQRSVRAYDYSLDDLEYMKPDSTASPSIQSIDRCFTPTLATSTSSSSMSSPSRRSDDRPRSNSAPQQHRLTQLHENTDTGLPSGGQDVSLAQTAFDVDNNSYLARRMYTDSANYCPVPPIPQEYLSEANQHINSTSSFRPPVIQERVSSARGRTKSKFRTGKLKSLSRRSTEDCAVPPKTERINAYVGEVDGVATPTVPRHAHNPAHGLALPETGYLRKLQKAPKHGLAYLYPESEEIYEPEFMKAREYCAPPPPSFTSLNYGQTRVIHPRPATSPRVHSFVAKSWRSRSMSRLVPSPHNDDWRTNSLTSKPNRDDEPRFASLGAFLDGYDDDCKSEVSNSLDQLVSDELLERSDTALDGMIRDLAIDIGNESIDAEPCSSFSHSAYAVDYENSERYPYDFDDSVFQPRIVYNGRLRRPGSICKPK